MSFFKILIGSVIGFAAVIGFAFMALYYDKIHTPFHGGTFDRVSWFSANYAANVSDAQGKCVRGPMVDDLIEQYLKPGTSYAQVQDFLGKPDLNAGDCVIYDLRCNGLDAKDNAGLNVCFDAQRKLIKAHPMWYRKQPMSPNSQLPRFKPIGKVYVPDHHR